MSGKTRILDVLRNFQEKDPQVIMSTKTIAYESRVGLNHTTRILEDLVIIKQVQKIQKSYRIYYRMIPPTD